MEPIEKRRVEILLGPNCLCRTEMPTHLRAVYTVFDVLTLDGITNAQSGLGAQGKQRWPTRSPGDKMGADSEIHPDAVDNGLNVEEVP